MTQSGWGRNPSFWLTTTRLIQDRRSGWTGRDEETVVLPLDQITGMSIGYVRHTRLLALGAALVLLGIMSRYVINPNAADVVWLMGAASTIAYVVTGSRAFIVRGHSVQIKLATRGGTADEVRSFINALEDARLNALGIEPDPPDPEEFEDVEDASGDDSSDAR